MNSQTTDHQKQQKQQILDKTQELLDLIMNSDNYIRYQKELETLKKSDELYSRMNEFRRKNFELQMMEEDSYEKMQNLFSEYKDTLMDPMVSRFMMTEQSICKLMRKVQERIINGVDLDISYMD